MWRRKSLKQQPRCRDIDPSNGLGQFLDMVSNPPDLELVGAVLDVATGDVFIGGVKQVGIPTFVVSAPANGVPVRVFVGARIHLAGEVTTFASSLSAGNPATAFVASGEIVVDGRFNLQNGGLDAPGCTGGFASFAENSTQSIVAGSGGGGFATAGGRGGDVTGRALAGAGGGASGTAELVPLRGGCSSGAFQEIGPPGAPDPGPGSCGGGAVQLSSAQSIDVEGIIRADGCPGLSDQITNLGDGSEGGGAGGGILLEAPNVTLGPAAMLLVRGGPGGGVGSYTAPPDSGAALPGIKCTSPTNALCGDGGNGAAAGVAAGSGESVQFNASVNGQYSGGVGGGGLGRIRINSSDQSYTKSNTTVEAGALTTGTLKTR